MRSRHATVSQLTVKGSKSAPLVGVSRAVGVTSVPSGAGGKGGSQTCERLVIRRPHHAARRRITRTLKQHRRGCQFRRRVTCFLTNVGIVMSLARRQMKLDVPFFSSDERFMYDDLSLYIYTRDN